MDALEKVRKEFEAKDSVIKQLKENESRLTGVIDGLTCNLAEANDRLSLQQGAIKQYKLDAKEHIIQYTSLQDTNASLRARIAELESSVRTSETSVRVAAEQVEQLREEWEDERERLKSRADRAESDREDVHKTLEKERGDMRRLQRQCDDLEAKIERLETELVIARASIAPSTAMMKPAARNETSPAKPLPLSPSRKQPTHTPIDSLSYSSLVKVHHDFQTRYDNLLEVHNKLNTTYKADLAMWKEYKAKTDTVLERRRSKVAARKASKKTAHQSSQESLHLQDVFASPRRGDFDDIKLDAAAKAEFEVTSPLAACNIAAVTPAKTQVLRDVVDRRDDPNVLQAPALHHLAHLKLADGQAVKMLQTPDKVSTPRPPAAKSATKRAVMNATPGSSKNNASARVSPWLGGPPPSESKLSKSWKRVDSFEEENYDPPRKANTAATEIDASAPVVSHVATSLIKDRDGLTPIREPTPAKRKAETLPAETRDPKRHIQITHEMLSPKSKAIRRRAEENAHERESMKIGVEVYQGYKSKKKVADPTQPDRHINELYEINPDANDGYDFAYHDVVRKKDDRKKLAATDCEECRSWWADRPQYAKPQGPIWKDPVPGQAQVDDDRLCEPCRETSRHRERFPRAKTPPYYWEIGFPSTATVESINQQADQQAAEKAKRIRREAEKENGQWRKKRS